MKILRNATIFWGVIGTTVAIILTYDSRNILQVWWDLSGVFAGAMLGLFLLGIISKRATNTSAMIGVAIGVIIIFWMSFANASWMPDTIRYPLHQSLIVAIGTLSIFLIGSLTARKN